MRSPDAPHCTDQTSLSAALLMEPWSHHQQELPLLQWCCWTEPGWRGVTELRTRDVTAGHGNDVGGKAAEGLLVLNSAGCCPAVLSPELPFAPDVTSRGGGDALAAITTLRPTVC